MFSPEEIGVEDNGAEETGDTENNAEEELHGTQDQQRVLANNWRDGIAEKMWTDAIAMNTG